jgi:two-component system, OmpR family, response regulator
MSIHNLCVVEHQARPRILVVDDEPEIRDVIVRALAADGYEADAARDGAHGLRLAEAGDYGLVILDLVMPQTDGRAVLARLRQERPGQPVLVLSCVSDVATKVDCLDLGAQDYLTKPFALAELLARVRVQLRTEPLRRGARQPEGGRPDPRTMPTEPAPTAEGRSREPGQHDHPTHEVLRSGRLVLDLGRLQADSGVGLVPLTRLEVMLLRELMEHAGRSVPKDELLATVWGIDFDPGSNVVDVCVRRLRSKLGFDLIETVRGAGYRLAS